MGESKIEIFKRLKKGKLLIWLFFIGLVFLLLFFSAPRQLFNASYSTVLESREGKLMGARIADDQQWRFPAVDSIPAKYETCLLQFEDQYFYWHPGINPVALFRALFQNLKAKQIVSGGSTITMQVCRLARRQKKRNIQNKLLEMLWAVNLELRYSKKEILNLYASHAPFGGNIVGIEAASWRYFGRKSSQLSWAETATLAVLPNAPSLIYPGKLDQRLKEKRDRLLKKLWEHKKIDSLTFSLSVDEPVPEKVNELPQLAYHLTQKTATEKNGQRVSSTIDYFLQERMNEIVAAHHKKLAGNKINNLAVLVAGVSDKNVLAYVGNVFDNEHVNHSNHVDIINAPRSSGSILKPFLYCKILDEGLLTPKMLIPDIPIRFGGFTPMNFSRDYNGAVPAEEALARSLNIPAVHQLQNYGLAPFYSFLNKAGMSTLTQKPGHYGLSLILGGAEVTLWDLSGMYVSLAAILENYNRFDGNYFEQAFSELNWIKSKERAVEPKISIQPEVRAASIYLTLKALLEVKRPDSEAGWETFTGAKNIAWKTGTSFGFRDAWAVGITREFVVAVWVGNADGEGRTGLTGIEAAAPVLFDVFSVLPASGWFEAPIDEMEEIEICAQSGFRPGNNCDSILKITVPRGSKVDVCPFHKKIHLNREETFRVNANCYPVAQMKHKNFFILSPAMEHYFKRNHPFYQTLPPLLTSCIETNETMEFIYPREWNKLFLPIDLDGTPGEIIFDLAHRQNEVKVFWYLDDEFIGTTNRIHQMVLRPKLGWHSLTLTDDKGNVLSRRFQVVNDSN